MPPLRPTVSLRPPNLLAPGLPHVSGTRDILYPVPTTGRNDPTGVPAPGRVAGLADVVDRAVSGGEATAPGIAAAAGNRPAMPHPPRQVPARVRSAEPQRELLRAVDEYVGEARVPEQPHRAPAWLRALSQAPQAIAGLPPGLAAMPIGPGPGLPGATPPGSSAGGRDRAGRGSAGRGRGGPDVAGGDRASGEPTGYDAAGRGPAVGSGPGAGNGPETGDWPETGNGPGGRWPGTLPPGARPVRSPRVGLGEPMMAPPTGPGHPAHRADPGHQGDPGYQGDPDGRAGAGGRAGALPTAVPGSPPMRGGTVRARGRTGLGPPLIPAADPPPPTVPRPEAARQAALHHRAGTSAAAAGSAEA
ncbi:MAG TPA: hypothetical protein VGJ07_32755, partial [Rugosimonospora sp.]